MASNDVFPSHFIYAWPSISIVSPLKGRRESSGAPDNGGHGYICTKQGNEFLLYCVDQVLKPLLHLPANKREFFFRGGFQDSSWGPFTLYLLVSVSSFSLKGILFSPG